MAELPGYDVNIQISDDDVTYIDLNCVETLSVPRDREVFQLNCMNNTTAFRRKLLGLKDGTVNISGPLDLADAGQNQLRARYDDGADCYIRIRWDGPSGTPRTVTTKVESYEESADATGLVEFSAALTFTSLFA